MEHFLQGEKVDIPVPSFAAASQCMAVFHCAAAILVEIAGVDPDLLVVNSLVLGVDVEDFIQSSLEQHLCKKVVFFCS